MFPKSDGGRETKSRSTAELLCVMFKAPFTLMLKIVSDVYTERVAWRRVASKSNLFDFRER